MHSLASFIVAGNVASVTGVLRIIVDMVIFVAFLGVSATFRCADQQQALTAIK